MKWIHHNRAAVIGILIADGFYERRRDTPKVSYPFDFHLKGDRPFVMAGIYEKATALRPATFCLLTTGPNSVMAPIHDRMPVILEADKAKRWLAREPIAEGTRSPDRAYAGGDMEAVPISTPVNSPKNDVPEVLEPVMAPPPKPRGQISQARMLAHG
jgi:putative SOS response-associated peptidase YedK